MLTKKLNKKTRRFASLIKATTLLLASMTVSTFNTAALADDSVKRGEALSQTCLGCHGAPGLRNPAPVYSIPMLGGQNKEYIVAALKAYKDKTRGHATMQAQSANLLEQDMQDIGAYFESVKGKSRGHLVNKAKAEAGKKIAGTCAGCHGADGAGTNPPIKVNPKLAGQYESYLIEALKQYRSGERVNPIMNGFAQTMSIQDIEALAAWFASQEADGVVAPQTDIFKF